MNNPQALEREYEIRFGEMDQYRSAVWDVLCSDFFSAYVRESDRVLDLGAGWGEFINHIKARDKLAMDLNPETGRRVSPGVSFLHQDCSQQWAIESGSLDVVFTSNFLEHLPDKPSIERAVGEAYRCLRPGGAIVCLGPNIKYLPGAYWDFWDHHVPITDRSLAELLRLTGFRIALCIDRFLPYSMSTGVKPPLLFLKYYLRVPFIWSLVGKQFFIVGRKPS